jgi:hypothetical protein
MNTGRKRQKKRLVPERTTILFSRAFQAAIKFEEEWKHPS